MDPCDERIRLQEEIEEARQAWNAAEAARHAAAKEGRNIGPFATAAAAARARLSAANKRYINHVGRHGCVHRPE